MFTFLSLNLISKKTTVLLTILLTLLAFMCQNSTHDKTAEAKHQEVVQPTIDHSTPDTMDGREPALERGQNRSNDARDDQALPNNTSSIKSGVIVDQESAQNEPLGQKKQIDPPSVPTPVVKKDLPAHTGGILVDEPTIILNAAGPDHTAFHNLLQKHVSSSGRVDYAGIKTEQSNLQTYLDLLKSNPPNNAWTKNARLAFWINAYNAFTIKLIIDNFPVSSIMDLDNGKPWDKKWIEIGSKNYTLNDIEHKIIRPIFQDARIHFAVNCAAKSCPPLANAAYTEQNVQGLLEERTKTFINNSTYNEISPSSAQVSKIFEWYSEDFGDLRTYLNRYASTNIEEGASIAFKDYDWKLNN